MPGPLALASKLPAHLVEAGYWWKEDEDFLLLFRGGVMVAVFVAKNQTERSMLHWTQHFFDRLTNAPTEA